MKILVIHNFYAETTGEDLSVLDSCETLSQSGSGIEVLTDFKRASDFTGKTSFEKVRIILKSNLSQKTAEDFARLLDEKKPDLALVHNLIPLIPVGLLKQIKKRKIPVALVIHNRRLVCPRGTCMLQGRFCDRCLKESALNCIRFKCLGSLFVSCLYAWRYRQNQELLKCVDMLVFPSQECRSFHKSIIEKKPSVVLREIVDTGQEETGRKYHKEDYVIFAARLVPEKGLDLVLEAAARFPKIRFKICGGGPLERLCRSQIQRDRLANVEYLGVVDRQTLIASIACARLLVAPSRCAEAFGRSIVEAMCLGTPVIASRLGAIPELIQEGRNGLMFDPAHPEDFFQKLERLWSERILRLALAKQAKESSRVYQDKQRYISKVMSLLA